MYKHSFRVCFCFRRRFRTNIAEAPKDVRTMFDKYSENGTMNIDHLQRFLEEIQGEASGTKAQDIFNNLKHLSIFQRRGLRLEDFFRYLLGDLNLAFSPSHGVISLSSLYFLTNLQYVQCHTILKTRATLGVLYLKKKKNQLNSESNMENNILKTIHFSTWKIYQTK